jgi:hypothetical protein
MALTADEMGRKGGKARAAKMTKEQRSEAASEAARARWGTKKKAGVKKSGGKK